MFFRLTTLPLVASAALLLSAAQPAHAETNSASHLFKRGQQTSWLASDGVAVTGHHGKRHPETTSETRQDAQEDPQAPASELDKVTEQALHFPEAAVLEDLGYNDRSDHEKRAVLAPVQKLAFLRAHKSNNRASHKRGEDDPSTGQIHNSPVGSLDDFLPGVYGGGHTPLKKRDSHQQQGFVDADQAEHTHHAKRQGLDLGDLVRKGADLYQEHHGDFDGTGGGPDSSSEAKSATTNKLPLEQRQEGGLGDLVHEGADLYEQHHGDFDGTSGSATSAQQHDKRQGLDLGDLVREGADLYEQHHGDFDGTGGSATSAQHHVKRQELDLGGLVREGADLYEQHHGDFDGTEGSEAALSEAKPATSDKLRLKRRQEDGLSDLGDLITDAANYYEEHHEEVEKSLGSGGSSKPVKMSSEDKQAQSPQSGEFAILPRAERAANERSSNENQLADEEEEDNNVILSPLESLKGAAQGFQKRQAVGSAAGNLGSMIGSAAGGLGTGIGELFSGPVSAMGEAGKSRGRQAHSKRQTVSLDENKLPLPDVVGALQEEVAHADNSPLHALQAQKRSTPTIVQEEEFFVSGEHAYEEIKPVSKQHHQRAQKSRYTRL